MKKSLRLLWCLLLSIMAGQTGYGQAPTSTTLVAPFCGTPNLPRAEALNLIQRADQAFQQKTQSGASFSTITYVPIRPHILRRSDGSGGLTLNELNRVMAANNSYFLLNGYGIQFFFSGSTPDYVDNDQQFASFSDEDAVTNGHDVTNAMNQYYVNTFASGVGGYAYFPGDALYSTRSFIGYFNNLEGMGNRIIPHELGHNFGLEHTFGGAQFSSVYVYELVTRGNGANCQIAGDYICDTPADPYNAPGANLIYQDGCPVYDPNSTARDANGDAYAPSITNIMSYYFPCTHDFTPGQYDRMQAALALRQSHTSYTLNAPPTNAAAPSNLTGQFVNGGVVLNWQDNANNEMGYFIERSLSPATGFLPIGGVGPDGTTFTDTKAVIGTTYYYRVHPSNTTTDGFSPTSTVRFDYPALTGLRTTNISANAATLNWNYTGNYTYDIQWRPVGSTTWNTISTVYTTSYTLSGLTLGVTYEWQAKITGGSTYAGPITFTTTTCPVPIPSIYTYPGPTSASINWESGNAPRTYTLQYRQQNTTAWTTIDAVSTSYYSLTGLTTQTPYDWRVRATCGGSTTIVTDYSPVQSFTTLACSPPTLVLNSYNSSSLSVYWNTNYYVPNVSYVLRYRAVGASTWTSVAGLTTSFYSVTGLAANTSYEIQVATNCSAQEQSDFSASLTATPACQSSVNLRYTTRATSAQLTWNTQYAVEPGTTFGLQYRPAGSGTWSNTVSVSIAAGLSGISYSLTGLTANTTYEWRVQTNCPAGAQSAYATGINFTTSCATPGNLYAYNASTTSASLSWYVPVELDTRFDVRYRVAGTANWTTLSNLLLTNNASNFIYSLTGLTNNTTYEWQVRTVCSPTDQSAFVTGQNFTTTCAVPLNLSAYNLTVSSVLLSWPATGAQTYELRYRQTGTVNWTNANGLTTSTFSLTGLQSGTGYEWQVRGLCDGGVFSDFSASTYFTTSLCSTPYSQYVYNQRATSAVLSWRFIGNAPDTRFEIRYRVAGTPDWTTVSSLSITPVGSTYGNFTVTGLTPDVPYEWQIRTVCSASESSAFSSSSLFSTCSQMYTVKAGSWTDATIWSCGRIPTATDTVQIKHTVTVYNNSISMAGKIVYDPGQTLIFLPGVGLRLGQ